jgi:hypothetical protein
MLSWLLVALGVLVSFAAFLKAYHAEDPYPGYGHVYRTLSAARDTYHEQVEAAVHQLIALRDQAIEELRDASEMVNTSISEAVDALYGQNSLKAHLEAFLGQCDLKVNRLLSIYRDANKGARAAPPPAHFQLAYAFDRFLGADPAVVDAPRHGDAETERRQVTVIVGEAVEAIFAECDTSITAYRSLEDLEETAGVDLAQRAGPRAKGNDRDRADAGRFHEPMVGVAPASGPANATDVGGGRSAGRGGASERLAVLQGGRLDDQENQ